MKICEKCHKELKLTEFPDKKRSKYGSYGYCKNCIKAQRKKFRYHNDPQFRKKCLKWSTKPPGSRNEYMKEYYRKNKEKMNKQSYDYSRKNREKINEWAREYYKDPAKRIARSMYNRVRIAIFDQLVKKSASTKELCGCTWKELVKHLESQFKEGMTWDNYGRGTNNWSIDHIITCSNFDLTKIEEQQKCFHYTNLQPLWTTENSSKRNFTLNLD